MRLVFADTFYFLALLNHEDEAHTRAVETTSRIGGALITSIWVLTEVGDAMAAPANRPAFLDLVGELASDPNVMVVEEPSSFREGVALFRDRPDKHWSLTDCISFAIMGRLEIRDALTGDHHFEQAGFNARLA